MLSIHERLSKMIANNAIPNSLLFAGSKEKTKEIALQFTADAIGAVKSERELLLKTFHPDVHHYFPEGKTGMHSIQSLRSLADNVALQPFKAPLQFFILHDAERMLPTSANALLKTFEEPTSHSIIILLSSFPDRILPTILSRCQILHIHADSSLKLTPLLDTFLDFLCGKKQLEHLDAFVLLIENEKKEMEENLQKTFPDNPLKQTEGSVTLFYQEKVSMLLTGVMMWYRDLYALKAGASEHLFFPEKRRELEMATPLPIMKIEKIVKEAHLAIERSIKLSVCLEALLIQISLLAKSYQK